MRSGNPIGPYFDVFDAPGLAPGSTIRIGVTFRVFQELGQRGLSTKIAQYYGNVQDALTNARHLFKGLKRNLLLNGNMNADKNVLVYAWRPNFDWVWNGDRQNGWPLAHTPLAERTFVVLATMLPCPDEHGVSAVIAHWTWVHEDPELSEAPINWEDRYTEKLWSN